MADVQHSDAPVPDDERVPGWWLGLLFVVVAASMGYWFLTHDALRGPAPVVAEPRPTRPEALDALMGDPAVLEAGGDVFVRACSSCHGRDGEGLVGPNLTDAYWLHGNSPEDLFKAVELGFPGRGMQAWGKVLGVDQTREVVVFLWSIRDADRPGKAPEGEALR